MISVLELDARLDLELLKKALWGLAMLVLLAIPLDLVMSSSRKPPSVKETLAANRSSTASFNESLASYEAAFDKSGLFGRLTSEGAGILKSSIGELVKDYRLKGVVLLDEPEAILEDARTQKSLFVKAGDHVGELTVKEIKEGKIILKYYGEEKVLQIE